MNAVDTSVVIAAFSSWHEQHEQALAALDTSPELPAHVALEAYSVLTRLPSPNRAKPADVRQFLAHEFQSPYLALSGAQVGELIAELEERAITGGATYDAVVGATARAFGATLFTCDRRAQRTYDRLGVALNFID
jgi:predicted nucleic acid-binding protein